MTITAAAIKDLREKTGAGMMDCKAALTETKGDFEAAVDWLRSKGLSKAAKKSTRVAAEGLVCVATANGKTAVVEVNSETDFVSKNDQFQALITSITTAALSTDGSTEALNNAKVANGKPVSEVITDAIATIGENISLRRATVFSDSDGAKTFSYIHNAQAPNMGKIGVLVQLKNGNEELGKQIAMHVAATKPESLNVASLDQNLVAREKEVYAEQARQSGKPENIIEKMIEGRVRKFYEQVVLLEQDFVMNPEKKVKDVLKEAGAELIAYTQYTVGEGIEKEESNFAEEVKAAVNG